MILKTGVRVTLGATLSAAALLGATFLFGAAVLGNGLFGLASLLVAAILSSATISLPAIFEGLLRLFVCHGSFFGICGRMIQ